MSEERFIYLNGLKIPVEDNIYNEYWRPEWREVKRAAVRVLKECSYEVMLENGYNLQDGSLVEDIVIKKLLFEELHAALKELTEDERRLIYLSFFDRQTEREIADSTGVSRQTIYKRKILILKKLKEMMALFN